MCWFGESVTWTSTLNLKHQNQLCCFVAIHKEHRAPVHPPRVSGCESVSTLEDASRFGVVLLFPLCFPD